MSNGRGRFLYGCKAALVASGAWLAAAHADAQALVGSMTGAACPSWASDLYDSARAQPGLLAAEEPGTVLCEYGRVAYTGYNLIGKYSSSWKKRKIVYVSSNRDGQHIAVTGTVVSPISALAGVRDVVAYAPSTVGLADKCAQSAAIDNNVTLSVAENGINQLLDTNRAVVVPDYEGLGTTADHPYLDGISSGHVTLDLLRAVGQLQNMNLASAPMYFMMGNSQGAQAVAWAAQLAPEYADDLPLKGAIAVATPVDLTASLTAVVSRNANGMLSAGATLVPFALQGASYILGMDAFFTPSLLNQPASGIWKSSALRNCTYQNLGYAFTDPLDYWNPPAHFFDVSSPFEGSLSAAVSRFRLGQSSIEIPFVLVHGVDDDVAPHYYASQLFGAWCAQGAPSVALHSVTGGTHILKTPGVMAENFDAWFTKLARGDKRYTTTSPDSRVDACQN